MMSDERWNEITNTPEQMLLRNKYAEKPTETEKKAYFIKSITEKLELLPPDAAEYIFGVMIQALNKEFSESNNK